MPEQMDKTCRACKAVFAFPMAEAAFSCPYCGTVNGRPKAKGADYEPLQRATIQRLNCDFRNAEDSYQHALRRQPEEHEALWGLALCRYGIEYVRDPRTGKLMPTVHGVCKKPIQRDKDFQNACRCAPEDVRAQYRAEAEYIDNTMAGIRQLAATKPDFDVFICHKSTIPGTKEDPTKDCMRGSAIAHMLDKLGYQVFFAPEVMQGVAAGSDYEAAIYHALDTAKVMLLICSDEDYINSAWVRSEWLRFLDMVDTREDKVLVPLFYGDFLPAQMPEELRPYNLEGVKMESLSAKDDLLGVVRTFCGSLDSAEPVPVQPVSESKPVPPVAKAKAAPVEKKSAPAKAAAKKKPAPVYAPETDFETEARLGGCAITKYKGKGGVVNVPPRIDGRKVVEIGMEAFKGCSSLTSIALPAEVTGIGWSSFEGCSNLMSVTLPESLTCIGGNVFTDCHKLTSITLPAGVKSTGDWVFKGCSSLTSITLPAGLTSIEHGAFKGCSSLTNITLPAGLTSIGGCAFQGCSSLTSITLPARVTSVGEFVFADCSGLTSITLPEGVTSIGEFSFSGCRSLTNVVFPESGCDIGAYAFKDCDKLPFSAKLRLKKEGAM